VSFRLENLTSSPVLIDLASGDALRLSPGETSESLAEVEVEGSRKAAKLVGRGVIAVHRQTSAQGKAKRGGKQAGRGSGRA
jgi:hypothetical protein